MPTRRSPISLDAHLQNFVTRAAATAVRQSLADEVQRVAPSSGTSQTVAPPSAVSPNTASSTRAPARRGQRQAPSADQVLVFVQENPGKRTADISKALGRDAKTALAKLRAQRAVKTEGVKRATSYFAATPVARTPARGAAKAARAKVAVPTRKPRSWPTCTAPGCTNRFFPTSGKARLYYERFVASGGRHPGKR